jgi:hypothetical protein
MQMYPLGRLSFYCCAADQIPGYNNRIEMGNY